MTKAQTNMTLVSGNATGHSELVKYNIFGKCWKEYIFVVSKDFKRKIIMNGYRLKKFMKFFPSKNPLYMVL